MLEINNTTKRKINIARTKKIVDFWLKENHKGNYSVSLALIGSGRMRRLNNDYRGIDKSTDVLSFAAARNNQADHYLGEIVINMEEIDKPLKYLDVFGFKKSRQYIFDFLLIHGLFHLIGYNDDTESGRLKMLALGENFLRKFY